MIKNKKSDYIPTFILWPTIFDAMLIAFLCFIAFHSLHNSSFVQDEYSGIGRMITILATKNLSHIVLTGPYRLLFSLLFFVEFMLFQSTASLYYISSVVFHALNAILLYLLALRFTRRFFAVFSSIIFAVSYPHHQAVTWISAQVDLFSLFFALLSFWFFIRYTEKGKMHEYILSLMAYLAALMCKETAATFLAPFFLYVLLFAKQPSNNRLFNALRISLPFLVIFLIFVASFAGVVSWRISSSENNGNIQESSLKKATKFVTIPFKGLTQSFLPMQMYYSLLPTDLRVGPLANPVLNLLSFGISGVFLLIVCLAYLMLTKNNDVYNARLLVFFTLWSITSFLPYGLLTWEVKEPFIESRLYYIPSASVSLLLGILLTSFLEISPTFLRKRVILPLLLLVVSLYVVYNINLIWAEIEKLVEISAFRNAILAKMLSVKPSLPEKSVIFMEGDMPPFQTNFGYILAVLYEKGTAGDKPLLVYKENFWELYNSNWLWTSSDGRQKFGYFRDFQILLQGVKNNSIAIDEIYAFKLLEGKITDETVAMRQILNFSKELGIARTYSVFNGAPAFVISDVDQNQNLTGISLVGSFAYSHASLGIRFNTTITGIDASGGAIRVLVSPYNVEPCGALVARISPDNKTWSPPIIVANPKSPSGWHEAEIPNHFINPSGYTYIILDTENTCACCEDASYKIGRDTTPPISNNSFYCIGIACNPFEDGSVIENGDLFVQLLVSFDIQPN